MVTENPFEIRLSQIAETAIVEALGEIDMATAPEVARAIDSVHGATRLVVVDLSGVTFLDSSALNMLLHCQRSLAERQVGFRIVSPVDKAVRRVFEITRLTGPLNVVDSLEDAIA
jgi:anti-sigma B factor antagonist